MDQAGVLPALRTRGYDPSVRIERRGGRTSPAGRRRRTAASPDRPAHDGGGAAGDGARRCVRAASRSSPSSWWSGSPSRTRARVFTRERPRLPGQTHPGLGLGRAALRARPRMGGGLGQGRPRQRARVLPQREVLRAAVRVPRPRPSRDGSRPFAATSPAAGRGGLRGPRGRPRRRRRRSGEPVTWSPGDMLAALSPPVREYLASPDYARAVAAAREARRFRVAESA